MSTLLTQPMEWLTGTHDLRDQLLASLNDDDLRFNLPNNPTLGELWREYAETERAYTDGFKTFKQSFDYGKSDPVLATSVNALKAYFSALDTELKAALEAITDEDVEARTIDRGWGAPVRMNFDFYLQAILIFYGKVTIYYRAMQHPLPEQWKAWIG